jgi:hypothetical protein
VVIWLPTSWLWLKRTKFRASRTLLALWAVVNNEETQIFTIKIVAACACIHWARSTFDRVNLSPLADLEHFDGPRWALDMADGGLLLLVVSATAIMQALDLLKTRR